MGLPPARGLGALCGGHTVWWCKKWAFLAGLAMRQAGPGEEPGGMGRRRAMEGARSVGLLLVRGQRFR